jgi:hypothetical protein
MVVLTLPKVAFSQEMETVAKFAAFQVVEVLCIILEW